MNKGDAGKRSIARRGSSANQLRGKSEEKKLQNAMVMTAKMAMVPVQYEGVLYKE